jgi:phage repressor protein C with HTH and peptisase S24 domain
VQHLELGSFNPAHEPILLAAEDLEWIARIVWASQ